MGKLSPTQRAKALFEKQGYVVAIVEKLNPWVGPPDKTCPTCGKNQIGIRQDLLGFGDLLAFSPSVPGAVLIQCTSGTNHATRRTKIMVSELARKWCKQDDRSIAVISFEKKGNKMLPRVEYIVFEEDAF